MKQIVIIFTFLFATNGFSQVTSEPRFDGEDLTPVRAQEVPVHTVRGPREDDISIIPFAVLEKIPAFKNCKSSNEAENRACFDTEIKKHIKKNLKYPKKAKKAKITARVIVLFEITEEGNISNLRSKVTASNKEYSADFEAEALRIINKLPQFIPGEHKGKAVVVSYAIPIIFSLTDK